MRLCKGPATNHLRKDNLMLKADNQAMIDLFCGVDDTNIAAKPKAKKYAIELFSRMRGSQTNQIDMDLPFNLIDDDIDITALATDLEDVDLTLTPQGRQTAISVLTNTPIDFDFDLNVTNYLGRQVAMASKLSSLKYAGSDCFAGNKPTAALVALLQARAVSGPQLYTVDLRPTTNSTVISSVCESIFDTLYAKLNIRGEADFKANIDISTWTGLSNVTCNVPSTSGMTIGGLLPDIVTSFIIPDNLVDDATGNTTDLVDTLQPVGLFLDFSGHDFIAGIITDNSRWQRAICNALKKESIGAKYLPMKPLASYDNIYFNSECAELGMGKFSILKNTATVIEEAKLLKNQLNNTSYFRAFNFGLKMLYSSMMLQSATYDIMGQEYGSKFLTLTGLQTTLQTLKNAGSTTIAATDLYKALGTDDMQVLKRYVVDPGVSVPTAFTFHTNFSAIIANEIATLSATFDNISQRIEGWKSKPETTAFRLSQGINDYHMQMLSYITTMIHSVSYAMQTISLDLLPFGEDGAHGGLAMTEVLANKNANGDFVMQTTHLQNQMLTDQNTLKTPQIDGYANFKAMLKQTYNSFAVRLRNMGLLQTDSTTQILEPNESEPGKRTMTKFDGVIGKMHDLAFDEYIPGTNIVKHHGGLTSLERLWGTYQTYTGDPDALKSIKDGDGIYTSKVNGVGAPVTIDYFAYNAINAWERVGGNARYGIAASRPATLLWYETAYSHIKKAGAQAAWNFIMNATNDRNFATAKTTYKNAKKTSDAQKEQQEKYDNDLLDQRMASRKSDAKYAESQEQKRQSETNALIASLQKKRSSMKK